MQTGRFTTAPDGRGLMIFDAFLENHEEVDPTVLGDRFTLQFMIKAEEDWINERLQRQLQSGGCTDTSGWIVRQASFAWDDLCVELDPRLNDVLVICEGSRFAVQVRPLAGVTVGMHTFLKDNLNLSRRTAPGADPAAASAQPAGPKTGSQAAGSTAPQGAPGPAVPPAAAKSSSALPKILGLVAVLLALAAAAYFLLGSDKKETAAAAPAETPVAAAEPEAPQPEPVPQAAAEPKVPEVEPMPPAVEPQPPVENLTAAAEPQAPQPELQLPVENLSAAAEPQLPVENLVAAQPEAQESAALILPQPQGAVIQNQNPACSLQAEKSDAEILSSCLSAHDEAALLQLARTAVEQQRCELAQRILFGRARSSGGDFARLLQQYFDPAAAENACFKKSAADAAYWQNKI